MSVTDNKYCNYAARENGGIPGGYGGDWAVNQNVADTRLVYWAESHDTYANDDWSQNLDQSVIDRAYAAYACRNGATALYLARPNTRGFNNIKVGKGSTAFKSKSITEVNKFRNVMTGKADWFESNGSACSITRENGGAVMVMKGSGNVSITNGGGYCPAGTYTDRVSGGTFTVTDSTISGNVGSSGIAVLYADGIEPDPNPDPDPDPNPDPDPDPDPIPADGTYVYFNNTAGWNVKVWAWNDEGNCCFNSSWPGDSMIEKNGVLYWKAPEGKIRTMIIFSNNGGEKAGGGDLQFYNGYTYTNDGSYKLVNYGDPNPDPDPDPVDEPVALYILGDINGLHWVTNDGVELKNEGSGVFASATKVTFEPEAGEEYCYFNLTDKLGADWNELNMNAYRFGPVNEGVELTMNNWGAMKKYANNVEASACKSWKVSPGQYYVRADFRNGKVMITNSTGIDLIDADADDAVYFTLDGVEVDRPVKGLYIKVTGNKATKVLVK